MFSISKLLSRKKSRSGQKPGRDTKAEKYRKKKKLKTKQQKAEHDLFVTGKEGGAGGEKLPTAQKKAPSTAKPKKEKDKEQLSPDGNADQARISELESEAKSRLHIDQNAKAASKALRDYASQKKARESEPDPHEIPLPPPGSGKSEPRKEAPLESSQDNQPSGNSQGLMSRLGDLPTYTPPPANRGGVIDREETPRSSPSPSIEKANEESKDLDLSR